jgi:hypothetical protein
MSKAGYVYILGNTQVSDIIKIGEAINAEERANSLSKQTGAIGKYTVLWKHKIDDDNRAVEKALHYKFREYSVDKEYFRIDNKKAIKIASQLVKDIKPAKNSKAKQYQSLKNKQSKEKVKTASKSLWNEIINSNPPTFIKETIKLCLKEGKIGQPQYRRFSAIRNSGHTGIGRADLYILKEHLRIVITNKSIHHAKRVVKDKIGEHVKVTKWEGGVSFFISDQKQYNALKRWFILGKKPLPRYVY